MWKFAAILLVMVLCVNAEEEQQVNEGQQTSSLVQTVLCYVSPKPWDCVKEQTGRTLDGWEQIVDLKRHELMVEADEEMKKVETSRSLSEDEKKEKPSEIMGTMEKGLSAIANMMTDEYNVLTGRESRALKKQIDDDDDTNDFNDDFSVYNAFSKAQAEGKLSDEARAKKLSKQSGGVLGYDDDGGYGGYNGYRGKGKKKKGKKGVMKMFFLGAIVKSKIELLLRILSFHLQLKFFAIALASLMINLARFWIDIKKQPQKVVYVEHAQHQHHYDEHDDWGNSWKRQSPTQEYSQDQNFAHRLAYNSAPQYPQH